MDERIDILLARYFSGEATSDELRQLDVWLSESKDHEDYFEQMTYLYRKISCVPTMPSPDTEKALASFKKHIKQPQQTSKRQSITKRIFTYGVAAAIALLAGVFVFINIKENTPEFIYLKAENADTCCIITPYTQVFLAKSSRIEYRNKEDIDTIKLFGKATFSIDSEKGGSILVQVGDVFIKDIGTCFTITAFNPKEEITIEVKEGEILFYSKNNPGVSLKENEVGRYNPQSNEFSQTTIESTASELEAEDETEKEKLLPLSTGKKSKKEKPERKSKKEKVEKLPDNLDFSATPLADVVEILKNRFHVDIIFEDNSMRTLPINASFNEKQSVNEILSIIAETLSIQISQHGNVYIISK